MRTRNTIPSNFVGITVTTPHFKREEEFKRMQFVVNVIHCRQPKPTKPTIAEMVRARLCLPDSCVLYLSKFQTTGPQSQGFGIAYDSKEDAEKHEPLHKLKKMGLTVNKKKTLPACKNKAKKMPNAMNKKIGNKK